MPHVQITMLAGRSVEQKRQTAKRITQILQEELGVNPEKLAIVFIEVPKENWASNGTLVSDRTTLT